MRHADVVDNGLADVDVACHGDTLHEDDVVAVAPAYDVKDYNKVNMAARFKCHSDPVVVLRLASSLACYRLIGQSRHVDSKFEPSELEAGSLNSLKETGVAINI